MFTMKRHLWKGQLPEQQIIQMYRDGAGAPTIAKKFGCDDGVIYRILQSNDIDTSRRNLLTEFQKSSIVELRFKKWSVRDIADELGVSQGAVNGYLQRQGIKGRVPLYRFSSEEKLRICSDYRAGFSKSAIARSMKVSSDVIRKVLEAEGLKIEQKFVTGPANHKWKGGRLVNADGYVKLRVVPEMAPYIPDSHVDRYYAEHRLVMAKHMGRPLARHEQVHHINGHKTDNRIENLQLRQTHHGQGVCLRCRNCGSTDLESVPIT